VCAKVNGQGSSDHQREFYLSARLMLPPDDDDHSMCVCVCVRVCVLRLNLFFFCYLLYVDERPLLSLSPSIQIHHGNRSALLR
jgi:hypothetical protein